MKLKKKKPPNQNKPNHSEAYFSLFMNTDVNYNPFAATRPLSLQFMIQAVTTSFDPILVMLISSHNGSKSVWFNCANCVSRGVVAFTVQFVCLLVWAYTCVSVYVCVRMCVCEIQRTVVTALRGVFVPKPKLPICILMSLACHIRLLQWYFKPRLCFQEHYTEYATKGLKSIKKTLIMKSEIILEIGHLVF